MTTHTPDIDALWQEYHQCWDWMLSNYEGHWSSFPYWGRKLESCEANKREYDDYRTRMLTAVDEIKKSLRMPHYFCWANVRYPDLYPDGVLTNWYCIRRDGMTALEAGTVLNVLKEMFEHYWNVREDDVDEVCVTSTLFCISALTFDFPHFHDNSPHSLLLHMFPQYPFAWWRDRNRYGDDMSIESMSRRKEVAIDDLEQKSREGLVWGQHADEPGKPFCQFLKQALTRGLNLPSPVSCSQNTTASRKPTKQRHPLCGMPFEKMCQQLPPLPEDGASNGDWIIASELTKQLDLDKDTLRVCRSRSTEKDNAGNIGRDSTRRIWQRSKTNSKAIFYLCESCPPPKSKPAPKK